LSGEPRLAERIDVYSLNAIGVRLYKAHIGQATIADRTGDALLSSHGLPLA
jgi:hypothetical protein